MLLVTTRAFGSNVVNRISPRLHVALRRATGRGPGADTPQQIADHYRAAFDRYFAQWGIEPAGIPAFLRGRVVLEYGPGDLPATAMLFVAHGAERAICADRFPLLRQSERNRAALRALAAGLPPEAAARLAGCFDAPDFGGDLRPERIRYVVGADGLSGLDAEADVAISCAVLEHVNRLDLTLADMARALRPGGHACHVVDLASHGFEWGNPLDFLSVGDAAWRLMSSHNGSLTNRLRLSDHRRILEALPLAELELRVEATLPAGAVEQARPHLAPRFKDSDDADLAALRYWLLARRA